MIELIIVLVIIGVMATFAIPGYLGVKQKAEGRGAAAQLMLLQAAEKMKRLEINNFIACTDYNDCNGKLNTDLPNDTWAYSVVLSGTTDFNAYASKDTCNYTVNKTASKPSVSSGPCAYTP